MFPSTPVYPEMWPQVATRTGAGTTQDSHTIMSTQTIAVHLPDGAIREVPAGTTPFEIANSISPRLAAACFPFPRCSDSHQPWSRAGSCSRHPPREMDSTTLPARAHRHTCSWLAAGCARSLPVAGPACWPRPAPMLLRAARRSPHVAPLRPLPVPASCTPPRTRRAPALRRRREPPKRDGAGDDSPRQNSSPCEVNAPPRFIEEENARKPRRSENRVDDQRARGLKVTTFL